MDNLFAEDGSMLPWLISMLEVHIKNLRRLSPQLLALKKSHTVHIYICELKDRQKYLLEVFTVIRF